MIFGFQMFCFKLNKLAPSILVAVEPMIVALIELNLLSELPHHH